MTQKMGRMVSEVELRGPKEKLYRLSSSARTSSSPRRVMR